jgi:hypothetical protein
MVREPSGVLSIMSISSKPPPDISTIAVSGSTERADGRCPDAAGRCRGGFPAFRDTPYTQFAPCATQRPQAGRLRSHLTSKMVSERP